MKEIQKKIEEILAHTLYLSGYPDSPEGAGIGGGKKAAAEIAKLFQERQKVIDIQVDSMTNANHALNKYKHELATKDAQLTDKDMTISVLRGIIETREEMEADYVVQIAEMQQWVDDLQVGTYVTCVYCGHNYGPNDEVPASMADALKEHIEECPKHPMSALRHHNAELLTQLAQMREALKRIDIDTDSLQKHFGIEAVETRRLVREALAAAPEMLWSGEAFVAHYQSQGTGEPYTALELSVESGHVMKEWAKIKVLVVKEGDGT